MRNWAGNLNFEPKNILAPKSTQDAQLLIQDCIQKQKKIRMGGSAHSWTDLIKTDEQYIHLDSMQGVLHVDNNESLITVKAGTKLFLFGEEAFKYHLALPNQGDINQQSVAGALSTGTHGTGITLQSMANQIHGLTLVTGMGDIVSLDKDKHPEQIKALSVSLGSVGLITEATLKMIPAYKLKVETFSEDMRLSLEKFDQRLKNNRHLEMFYFPVGDWSIVKLMNETQGLVSPQTKLNRMSDVVLENWLYEGLNMLVTKTGSYKSMDRLIRKFVGHKTFINWSHRAFPTERSVRFMEMEFNLPLEKFQEVFDEIKFSIRKNHFKTLFPIEIRFVKGDDLWLSPAYQRDSVYFAIHTYVDEDYRDYFQEMQHIFKRHGGRPHWGKWHTTTSAYLATVYPKWHDFLKLRNELDPNGLWLNEYLKKLFFLN